MNGSKTFKVQRPVDFHATENKKFINGVFNATLQLTFKKLPLIPCGFPTEKACPWWSENLVKYPSLFCLRACGRPGFLCILHSKPHVTTEWTCSQKWLGKAAAFQEHTQWDDHCRVKWSLSFHRRFVLRNDYGCKNVTLKCSGFVTVSLHGIHKYFKSYTVSTCNMANITNVSKSSPGLSTLESAKWSRGEEVWPLPAWMSPAAIQSHFRSLKTPSACFDPRWAGNTKSTPPTVPSFHAFEHGRASSPHICMRFHRARDFPIPLGWASGTASRRLSFQGSPNFLSSALGLQTRPSLAIFLHVD